MSTVSRMKVKPRRGFDINLNKHVVEYWGVFTAAGSLVHKAFTQHEAMTWAYEFAALQGWTK